MMRRRGGLVRAAATTAVVAGTAGAVRHRQDRSTPRRIRRSTTSRWRRSRPPRRRPLRRPAQPDYAAELEQLAQLKAQGILTEEEFEAKKKQILGI